LGVAYSSWFWISGLLPQLFAVARTGPIEAILETGKARKLDRDIRLMAGTVLTREYQGIEHRVALELRPEPTPEREEALA
jgi:hypothetical protein